MIASGLGYAFMAAFITSDTAAQGDKQSALQGTSSPVKDKSELINTIRPRQDSKSTTCNAFGIDFQDGGSYFIDSRSNASYTCVSQFEGCQNDTASVLLVNDQTSDQYECTSVPTLPDDTSQLSTCPIDKSQMTTGNWSILALGNNGDDGAPFAWERNFYLKVGIPETTTVTPTVTYSITSTPLTTITTTSTVVSTSTAPNHHTITVPGATRLSTINPKPVTSTSTSMITRHFDRWTKAQTTLTQTLTASCTVPPRPLWPDPICHHIPTIIPIPHGLEIAGQHFKKRSLARRTPDAATVTSTAGIPVNTTTTVLAAPSTVTDVSLTTSTVRVTAAPKTVRLGTTIVTTTLSPETKVIERVGYTVEYATRTFGVTWTATKTITPNAVASECKRQGGSFGLGDL